MNKPIHLKILLIALLSICTSWAFAQSGSISGTIIDENGDGLPSANVKISETGQGTSTDLDGNFKIENVADGTYNLVVSFIGYTDQTKSVTVSNGSAASLNFDMSEDAEILDEVFVIGYGTSRKRELSGSISKIGAEDASDILGNSFDANLQGKAAGVQVIQSSGIAGSGAYIRIRGNNSLTAGGDPLVVIDGIPVAQDPFLNSDRGAQNNNPLSAINPNDIESIEILKDAAAAAIYGSRGANGVILITTKRGKTGKPSFEFTSSYGISQPAINVTDDYVTKDEWLQLRQEAWENDGNVGRAPLPNGLSYDDIENVDTDWFDLLLRTGFKQEYGLSFSQGTDKISTYANVGYLDAQSYMVGNTYERINGRLNLDIRPIETLTISPSSSLSRGFNNRVSQAWEGGLGFAQSIALPIYSADSLTLGPSGGARNPVMRTDLIDWKTVEWRSINNLAINYQPVTGLTLNANVGYEYMDLSDNIYEDSLWDITNRQSRAKYWRNKWSNLLTSGNATYDLSAGENSHFKFMVGAEYQRTIGKTAYLELTDVDQPIFQNPEIREETDTVSFSQDNIGEATKFIGTFARIQYGYKDKIHVTGTIRRDGSSKFGANRKFGYFPSIGVNYILSEEAFMKSQSVVSFLKLKASYGISGNADIPFTEQFGGYNPIDSFANYNNNLYQDYNKHPNPDLGWEKNNGLDLGFEIGFLNDRITSEFSFYNQVSTDVIVNSRLQSSVGGDRDIVRNVAEVLNRGVELQIISRNIVKRNFVWRTDLNIAHNHNEVLDIGNAPPDAIAGSGDTRVVVGEPVGVNFLVRFSHVDQATGLPVFLDADGNETFDWSEENRVIVGNVRPIFEGGLNNNFTIGAFDIEIATNFSYGGKIYDDAMKRQLGVVTDWVIRRDIIDNRWTQPGDEAEYPLLTMVPQTYGGMGSEWFYNTTQWLFDASYLRVKKVGITYTVPNKAIKKMKGVSGIRLQLSAVNLLTFTKYPGDPEIVRDHNGPQGRNISPNVTYLTPPQERSFNFALKLNF